jgi:hypothetical protein
MSEEEAKLIGDAVVEWLYGKGKIPEDTYGKMDAADREAIAQAVLEVVNQ